ncbi:hypothetical protein RA210_U10077 [Rubrivivax sp. A210]|uniref:hypothetical protein n=1 Tax=Rubrivivax sp. A210 TaxID=2772301 RepID=UPI00191AF63E|nr:hypothetical protein [Rubrivivax sp. A210]CAD5365942.1 hypothetical protein RA210_U10077 [Rubrivivax sp. A210]
MCHYLVLDIDPTAHWLGLRDGYGKHHLARVANGAMAVVGDELHGAAPALGLNFLSSARSGHRLSAQFAFLRVSRQAMVDHLHPPQRRGPAAAAVEQLIAS